MKLFEIKESAFDKMTRAILPELREALMGGVGAEEVSVIPIPIGSAFKALVKPVPELNVAISIRPKTNAISRALHEFLATRFEGDLLLRPRVFTGASGYLLFMEPRREAS